MNNIQWAQAFLNSEKREMTDDEQELFVVMRKSELDLTKNDNIWSVSDDDESVPPFMRMFMKRCNAYGLRVTKPTMAFISCAGLCENPAHVTMYCEALYVWQNQLKGEKEIDLEVIGFDIFPEGFPTYAALQSLWDLYKTIDTRPVEDNSSGGSMRK